MGYEEIKRAFYEPHAACLVAMELVQELREHIKRLDEEE